MQGPEWSDEWRAEESGGCYSSLASLASQQCLMQKEDNARWREDEEEKEKKKMLDTVRRPVKMLVMVTVMVKVVVLLIACFHTHTHTHEE